MWVITIILSILLVAAITGLVLVIAQSYGAWKE
jgi:hypothetical protein